MKTGSFWFLVTCLASLSLCPMASSQATETVLYSFGAFPTDGINPFGGLLFDAAGNIYGATNVGGAYCVDIGGCGTIYKLSPSSSGVWTEAILFSFCSTGNSTSCPDGSYPLAGLIMDSRGSLYGTTTNGGPSGVGTVFRLSPPSAPGGSWSETVLWNFSIQAGNGRGPGYGKLNADAAGNLYGTTLSGGSKNAGAVYELSPQSDGTYSFSILHSFSGPDGATPEYGVTFDSAGNLYGTTSQGGRGKSVCEHGCGLVYELSPSGGAWAETVLFEFDGVIGAYPISPISLDKVGNLYGTFEVGGGGECVLGIGSCGGVFKLVPGSNRKYAFYFNGNDGPNDGNPQSGVAVGVGNTLYGVAGASKGGDVYMLQNSSETILYNFCSLPNCADGSAPSYGNIVLREGALYGTTISGGLGGGVVYQLSK